MSRTGVYQSGEYLPSLRSPVPFQFALPTSPLTGSRTQKSPLCRRHPTPHPSTVRIRALDVPETRSTSVPELQIASTSRTRPGPVSAETNEPHYSRPRVPIHDPSFNRDCTSGSLPESHAHPIVSHHQEYRPVPDVH